MILDDLSLPVVLAPLAGGPSTPELAAAVSNAGGLGFLASGYLPAGELSARLRSARGLTDAALGVNLFCPGSGPSTPDRYGAYLERLRDWAGRNGPELGEPRYSDDDWAAKLERLGEDPAEVVSFTFGCPSPEVIRTLKAAGSEVWITVTSPGEAWTARTSGADVLVVQGAEAGGHRASFTDSGEVPLYGLLPLLGLIEDAVSLPLVASGGVATGAGLAAVLAAGARAAQVGTAFMLAPEAGTAPAHRAALRTSEPTALTRAFTGRLARGIRNEFLLTHGPHAPAAYPELHYVTAPMRRRAREEGRPELLNLWAGESHELAEERPAAEIAHRLASGAVGALARVSETSRARPASGPGASSPGVFEALIRAWYAAWNAHDLERVLAHYTEDVVFSSPFISALGAGARGVVVGKPALRAYWSRALERYPDLHFEPISELYGVGSITLHYRGVANVLAAEVLELNAEGYVFRATAHYDRMP
jgi:nitronate monooxygenase